MPQYFFHQWDGACSYPDEEGRELPDLGAARAAAIAGLRSIVAESVLHGRLSTGERVDIHNEAGQLLLSLGFADAVEVDGTGLAET